MSKLAEAIKQFKHNISYTKKITFQLKYIKNVEHFFSIIISVVFDISIKYVIYLTTRTLNILTAKPYNTILYLNNINGP